MKLGLGLPGPVRQVAGEAWASRTHVEEISAVQFFRLSAELAALNASPRLLEVASRAVHDETRHRELCAELAQAYGVDPGPLARAPALAPAGLELFERCLYAAVAHCCVAETESMATLSTLVREAEPPEVRRALVAIARDEVEHAQLGWAIAAWAAKERSLSFLGRALPSMLEPGAGPLFRQAPPAADDGRLALHGVLPWSRRRQVFLSAFEEVLIPGWGRFGIDGAAAREWLRRKG